MFHLKAQTTNVVLMIKKRVILEVMDKRRIPSFYFEGIAVFADAR